MTTLSVSPWEAALGCEAPIRTLDGDVQVKIPPGSSSGRKIRLRGKGFPETNGGFGDLLAEIRILVPEEPSDSDRELYERLSETSEFQPRG